MENFEAFKEKAKEVIDKYSDIMFPWQIKSHMICRINGNDIYVHNNRITLNEYICFDNGVVSDQTAKFIQEYFGFLALKTLNNMANSENGELKYEDEIEYFECNINMVSCGHSYKTSDLFECVDLIMNKLPDAESFSIFTRYDGMRVSSWFEGEHLDTMDDNPGFENMISMIDPDEKYIYRQYLDNRNSEDTFMIKIENGEYYDIKNDYTTEIVNSDCAYLYSWCRCLDLFCEYDAEKNADFADKFSKFIETEQSENILSGVQTETDEVPDKPGRETFFSWTVFNPDTLKEAQDFIDRINDTFYPLPDGVSINGVCKWIAFNDKWVVAELFASDDGLYIAGTEF